MGYAAAVNGRARSGARLQIGLHRLWLLPWIAASCHADVREPRAARSVAAPATNAAPAAEGRSMVASPALLERAPPPALQPLERGTHALQLGGSVLRVTLDEGRFELGAAAVLDWIRRSAQAVEAYYGVFPVREAELFVHAARGRGVHGGHAQPGSVPRVDINVGMRASLDDLRRNWSLVHELVHLALPNLASRHHWLEEGLASYVEPVARVRAGLLEEADVWREWLDNLALGQPEAGDRGLDHTPTWGRTYWGGALFCFQANLEILAQSGGRFELRDALRGILAEGGNITVDWPIERVLRAGDAATGLSVLQTLYTQLKDQPVPFELTRAWRELGVSEQAGEIRFDDTAPRANLRKIFVRGR